MSEVNEFVEKMEHAAHGAHGAEGGPADHAAQSAEYLATRNLGRHVGITMAVLGVILALGSALVGRERTELVTSMVEQTNTALKFQAISTKHRTLMAQLQQLHSLFPDPRLFNKWEQEVKKLQEEAGGTEAARIMRMIRLENAKNLNAEIPSHADMVSFVGIIRDLDKEREAAQKWTESYEDAISAHCHAAEHYEWALLASEIGIVIASVALLLLNRQVWLVAIALGLAALGISGETYLVTSTRQHEAEARIAQTRAHFQSLSSEKKSQAADEELLKSVEAKEPLPLLQE